MKSTLINDPIGFLSRAEGGGRASWSLYWSSDLLFWPWAWDIEHWTSALLDQTLGLRSA